MSLQNDLANYSFLSLLGSMILYWVSTLFGEEPSPAPHQFAPTAKNESEGLQNPTVPSSSPTARLAARCSSTEGGTQAFQKPTVLLNIFDIQQKSKIFEEQALLQKTTFYQNSKNFEDNPSDFDKNRSFNENGQKLKNEEAELGKANSPQNWFAIQNLARYGIIISNILLGLLLILRWKESGHFPLSNLYESLMFLSWCFTGLYLFIDFGSDLRGASFKNLLFLTASLSSSSSTFGGTTKKDKNYKIYSLSLSKNTRQLLGAITTPSALLTNAFATFTLPKEMQEATPLVPALQSNWLMMHVTVMVLSYAALILGSLLSIAFLIVTAFAGDEENVGAPCSKNVRFLKAVVPPSVEESAKKQSFFKESDIFKKPFVKKTTFFYKPSFFEEARFFAFSPLRNAPLVQAYSGMKQFAFSEQATVALSPHTGKDARITKELHLHQSRKDYTSLPSSAPRKPIHSPMKSEKSAQNIKLNSAFNSNISPLAITLDNLSYRILGIGFPFLTIGILSGAVWANEAWGSYWSWDPKETWALLTWLIFAIYLHTRLSKGWEGKKPAIIASLGFVIVWICYLGVNLIGEGLHSYGWISST